MNSRQRLSKSIEEAEVKKSEQVFHQKNNVFALLRREEGHVDAEQ
jgi:hypothetical protein